MEQGRHNRHGMQLVSYFTFFGTLIHRIQHTQQDADDWVLQRVPWTKDDTEDLQQLVADDGYDSKAYNTSALYIHHVP